MSALSPSPLLRPARSEHRGARATAPASVAWSEAQAAARGRSASRDTLALLGGAIGFADAAIIFAASLLAYILRHGIAPVPMGIISTTALAGLLTANALSIAGAYTRHIRDSVIAQSGRAAQAWTVVFLLLLTIGYLTKALEEYSRVWAILWYLAVLAGLVAKSIVVMDHKHPRGRYRLLETLRIYGAQRLEQAGEETELARGHVGWYRLCAR